MIVCSARCMQHVSVELRPASTDVTSIIERGIEALLILPSNTSAYLIIIQPCLLSKTFTASHLTRIVMAECKTRRRIDNRRNSGIRVRSNSSPRQLHELATLLVYVFNLENTSLNAFMGPSCSRFFRIVMRSSAPEYYFVWHSKAQSLSKRQRQELWNQRTNYKLLSTTTSVSPWLALRLESSTVRRSTTPEYYLV